MISILKKRPDLAGITQTLQDLLKEEARLREEFYNTITEDDKAEFINGEIIMHSPVKLEHVEISGSLQMLLRYFVKLNDLGSIYTEKAMVHLSRNSYEPDIVFFRKEVAKDFKTGQMLFPAPDFIVEILSPSTEKNDRGIKFEDYALHSITEYWIIDPPAQTVEQYLLHNNEYKLEFKGTNGVITSKAIKGFACNVNAIFNDAGNMDAMRQLLKRQ